MPAGDPFQAGPPHPGLDARTLPSVCRGPQPHEQGAGVCRRPERRAEPARTLSSPKGRRHGRGAGCSSCRRGKAGTEARRPEAAEPRTRGTQRSRGSIAEQARATKGQPGQDTLQNPRATGSPASAQEALLRKRATSPRPDCALCWEPPVQLGEASNPVAVFSDFLPSLPNLPTFLNPHQALLLRGMCSGLTPTQA